MRFNRDYELTVNISNSQAIIIKPPINIAFSCDKSTKSSLNKLTLRIFNLNESHRLALIKDKLINRRIPLILKLGYDERLEKVFTGDVKTSVTVREGVDFVTQMECYDGGFDYLNSFTSRTVKGKDTAVNAIMQDMPNTAKGKITQQRQLLRPKVLVGSSSKLIEDQLDPDESFFIDGEQLFILKDDEVVSSYIPVVTGQTGLINTPERENSEVSFQTTLNPALRIGGLCKIESKSAPYLNDVYKITTINYNGELDGEVWTQSVIAKLAGNYKAL